MISILLFVAAGICWLAAVLQHLSLVTTIRQYHPDYYQRLGEPAAFFVMPWNIGSTLSFTIYVISGEFKSDEVPEDMISDMKICQRVYFGCFAFVALGVIFAGF